MQCERDRCKSPSTRASTLLAKVAVVAASPQPMASTPSAPRMATSISNSSSSSSSNSPVSTPPGDGGHFPFGMSSKELPESPDGGYISFPEFEGFGGYKSDDERDGGLLPLSKR